MLTVADPLHDLKVRFLDRCREHAGSLNELVENPERIKQGSDMDSVVKIVHSIAGTGGIFGFHEMSAKAHELETVLIAKDPVDQPSALWLLKLLCREISHVLADHECEAGRSEFAVNS